MSDLILGFGKTGAAVYEYIKSRKKYAEKERLFIYDDTSENAGGIDVQDGNVIFFNKQNEEILLGRYFKDIEKCIVSPGIPRDHQIILKLKRANIPVLSEIEFAYNNINNIQKDKNAKIIAITGTNGKTTSVTLCKSAIEAAGLSGKTFVGGNLGVPFISGIDDYEDFILEISSFQLEWIYDFKPDIAVLLNVEDDHMDRYLNFDEYRLTKYKMFKNLRYNDVAVLNGEDYNSSILKGVVGSNTVLYGFEEDKCDVFYKDGFINLRLKDLLGFNAEISLKDVADKRKFVIEDMMAAACSLALYGISPDVIKKAFDGYRLLKHRVECIGSIDNVYFYDDSKATNPAAVISALNSFGALSEDGVKTDIVLILGGKDKGFNYESIVEPVKRSVKACVLMGETKEVLEKTLKGRVEYMLAGDMEDAVVKSFNYLKDTVKNGASGTVLLSPASSSFDMFKDYGERGDVFKKCFEKLKNNFYEKL
ncbi:MAG: UDP-N-acetylmuramoyl-L-alanine--D-glutamate ligase [Candidatus Acidulodesulfobacterium acidiphilum]|uniref:UDP-N-acetylmuramoylalanine--D-glutamate ligase n=1 Tax=Candidatus Acidulodesulfobacterium acidiphilum TaxID=2597224 RepID=A0A520XBR1_9DELT|nr:MAG: UDP-N-acetylmuramoyl-L-alanine--D-glutamate ligase [Candidatus Acidulodesulfobacterium acidiphilum]